MPGEFVWLVRAGMGVPRHFMLGLPTRMAVAEVGMGQGGSSTLYADSALAR